MLVDLLDAPLPYLIGATADMLDTSPCPDGVTLLPEVTTMLLLLGCG